ncbi:YfbM family protein [Streptomyces nigrescens]|uniref:YfbM family protein n=1 Tax=Streptomyces nigrescens TaxID=1920 RepID=A0ABY7JG73_STRNI|nr:YfbM family protein [Streptomyces nigrescens]WAU08681.1 YfbM family protein [Streptomyces nigrescens]
MGVSIGFISATTEELDRAEKDPSWADDYVFTLYADDDFPRPDRPYGGPDKAWAGLQFLLDETDVRLDFLMDGFPILEDGSLFGWSAEQIESVARQLQATPWEQLAAHYAPEKMTKEDVYPNMWRFDAEGELEWLERAYEELVPFFVKAADGGYGAFMTFSF